MLVTTHLVVLAIALVPAPVEVVAAVVLRGSTMDPNVALAVYAAESGHLQGADRDRAWSPTHDAGRMQVNVATHWKRLGFQSPAEARQALHRRHYNIWAGTGILIGYHLKYAPGPGPDGDRYGRPGGWPGRYNGSGPGAEAYGRRIIAKVQKWERMRARRW